MNVDDVMLYGKVYDWARSKAYHEAPVRLVPCGCGADIDEQCLFRSGRGTVPHADRRVALKRWLFRNEEHQAEYEELKQELIRYYVALAIQEVREEKAA